MKKATGLGLLTVLSLLLGALGCSKPKEQDKDKGSASKDKKVKREQIKIPPCPEEDKTKVVAEVEGIKITKCDVYDKIHQLSPYIRKRYTSLERKKDFLDRMIRFEIMAAEAARQGLDKDPDVQRAKKDVMVQKLTRTLFKSAMQPTDVSEAELREYYDKHQSDYNKPAMVRVSHILLKTKEAADKLLDQAKKADHRKFRELAKDNSIDEATKVRGGDLRYFPQDEKNLPKALVDEAFKLSKVGDTVGPIKSDKGFHIIRLTGKRRPITRQFHQVKQLLKNRILRQKRTDAEKKFVDDLKAKTKPLEIFEDKLPLVKICKGPVGMEHGGHHPHHHRGMRGMPPHMGRGMRPHRKATTPARTGK